MLSLLAGCKEKVEPQERRRVVVRVVDGDTIVLDGQERVRLIGVNTPESVDPRRPVQFFGREAATFAQELLRGKKVTLGYEGHLQDRYGRTLAYVYLEDGTLANAEIIRQGYGFAYTKYPFSKMDEFRILEYQARNQKRGLWGRR